MSKFYMVKLTSISMVLVEVADEESEVLEIATAQQVAMDGASGNDLEAEVESGPMVEGSDELASAKRHCDAVNFL